MTISLDACLPPEPVDSPDPVSLDGLWQCCRWPFPGGDEASLTRPEQDDDAWETVLQPGKVFYADPEAEAQDIPNWNRVTLAHIDPEDGAVLRRRVSIPASWAGCRIVLQFDGVFPAARFYLDGMLLGEHLSGLTPAVFDVTERITPGRQSVIAVRLIRRHPYVQLDMVRHALEFAGLAQTARLFAVQPCHIADYHLVSDLSEALDRGTLDGDVTVLNAGDGAVAMRLDVTVSRDVDVVASTVTTRELAPGERATLSVRTALTAPLLWNDEFPNLYAVELTLHVAGQPVQTCRYRTGFRRFDLTPDGPRLNGNPVKFRGVNHLTFHPDHGMYTPTEWLRRNLLLMKRANVNTIRTHFLGPRPLAELCDELGIYLLQELPIDWGTDYIHDPDWFAEAVPRIESGVRRDRHHPAVMVWSVGNENMPKTPDVAPAGWAHLRRFEAAVKALDRSRPTLFPPPGPANAIDGIIELRVGDIADTHYSFRHIQRFLEEGAVDNPNSWEADMVRMTRDEALARGWSGVWFSSEYGIFNAMPDLLHSPWCSIISDVPEDPLSGKSTLAAFEERLRREWGLMRSEQTCLGGAYFPWLCAGAGNGPDSNPWGWVRWGEDADWGVVTADLLPKPCFWVMRALFSPVWFPSRLRWQPDANEIRFTIENQYNAIDLRDCTLRVQQNGGGTYMTMMRKFQDIPVTCPPGETCELRIPLTEGALKALRNGTFALVRLTLLDPSGYRPITAELLVLPPEHDAVAHDRTMTIGPDAVL